VLHLHVPVIRAAHYNRVVVHRPTTLLQRVR
jgi:hypothetical protein